MPIFIAWSGFESAVAVKADTRDQAAEKANWRWPRTYEMPEPFCADDFKELVFDENDTTEL